MSTLPLSAVILAAGSSSRFKSTQPKVVHHLLGRPMVSWVAEACREAGCSDCIVVVSPSSEAAIRQALPTAKIAIQPSPKGTGDAVLAALNDINHNGLILVAAGDTPCLTANSLASVIAAAHAQQIAVATCQLAQPRGYGRIVRDSLGNIARIVEDKDASPSDLTITEVNVGLYVFPVAVLRTYLPQLKPNNKQGELYLVDIIALAAQTGVSSKPILLPSPDEVQGVNDRTQLESAERYLRHRINHQWQLAGVSMADSSSTRIEPSVRLAADVELAANVSLLGQTSIGSGSRIGQGCVLSNTHVGQHCVIKPYVICESAQIADNVSVGPFAHLREGTLLETHSRIGNFVETKKLRLGRGSKANHLTYLGDADIGANVNVGAGTITCNYDGANKHKTTIEDDVFVGSDTQFVAPVHIGKGATIGAGATITRDVPAGALAVSRTPQKDIAGYKRKQKTKS